MAVAPLPHLTGNNCLHKNSRAQAPRDGTWTHDSSHRTACGSGDQPAHNGRRRQTLWVCRSAFGQTADGRILRIRGGGAAGTLLRKVSGALIAVAPLPRLAGATSPPRSLRRGRRCRNFASQSLRCVDSSSFPTREYGRNKYVLREKGRSVLQICSLAQNS